MKIADLTSGAAKISSAYKKMRLNWDSTKDHWRDENRNHFEKNYLDPLGTANCLRPRRHCRPGRCHGPRRT